jgi:hypothetical protein
MSATTDYLSRVSKTGQKVAPGLVNAIVRENTDNQRAIVAVARELVPPDRWNEFCERLQARFGKLPFMRLIDQER